SGQFPAGPADRPGPGEVDVGGHDAILPRRQGAEREPTLGVGLRPPPNRVGDRHLAASLELPPLPPLPPHLHQQPPPRPSPRRTRPPSACPGRRAPARRRSGPSSR